MKLALKNLIVLSILVVNAMLSVYNYYFNVEFSKVYFCFSLISFIFIVLMSFDNIIFAARYFFLGVVGHLAAAVKFIDTDAKFGHHMIPSQSVEIVSVMLYMTNVALLFCYLGFSVGNKISTTKKTEMKNENLVFLQVSIILFVFISILLNASRGPIIFYGSYGT
ncbi:hypothetical protein F7U76_21165, partial [Vibrio vulnificus]|nr:hypothetical protein [Vibrio vulnificus]